MTKLLQFPKSCLGHRAGFLGVYVQDRVGHDKSDQEAAILLDQLYCHDRDYSLTLVVNGVFQTYNHPDNAEGRNNVGVVLSRKTSIETIGLLELRLGPWLIDAPPGEPLKGMGCMHWGCLTEGIKAAWLDPANANNKNVMLAVSRQIRGCKRYFWNTPPDARFVLKYLGNIVNKKVADTTIMEIWHCTHDEVEPSWYVRRNVENDWKVSIIGQVAYDKKKWELVQALFPYRWER